MRFKEQRNNGERIVDLALAIKELSKKINSGVIAPEDLLRAVKNVIGSTKAERKIGKDDIEIEEIPGIIMPENGTPAIREALAELNKGIETVIHKQAGDLVSKTQFEEYMQISLYIDKGITSGKLDANFFRNIKSIN